MVRQLQKQLHKACIGLVILSFSWAVQAESALQSDEQQQYLQELRTLYLTKNDREALLRHANSLLQTHAYRAGYQVGQADAEDLIYQLSSPHKGLLVAREERRQQGRVQVRNNQLAVFGIDPFIEYRCEPGKPVCQILSPRDNAVWLTIVRDHEGAAELAKTLSFLIRNLQRG